MKVRTRESSATARVAKRLKGIEKMQKRLMRMQSKVEPRTRPTPDERVPKKEDDFDLLSVEPSGVDADQPSGSSASAFVAPSPPPFVPGPMESNRLQWNGEVDVSKLGTPTETIPVVSSSASRFTWEVELMRNTHDDLTVTFKIDPIDRSLTSWTLHLRYIVILESWNPSHNNHIKDAVYDFPDSAGFLDVPVYPYQNLEHPNNIYIKDGKIKMSIEVIVTSLEGMFPAVEWPISEETNALAENILIIEGKRIAVDKHLLAYWSDFLRKMFFGTFREARSKEVELKGVTYEGFVTWLKCVLPNSNLSVTPDNVNDVLKTALFLQSYRVIEVIDAELEAGCGPLYEMKSSMKLLLAMHYDLPRLRCRIAKQRDMDAFEQVVFSEEFEKFYNDAERKFAIKVFKDARDTLQSNGNSLTPPILPPIDWDKASAGVQDFELD